MILFSAFNAQYQHFGICRALVPKIFFSPSRYSPRRRPTHVGGLPKPPRRPSVAEPPELFRLKCASHRCPADTNSTHFKRNNPLVCRVSARYNHGSTGPRQVYLTRRRVYNHSTAHQLLIYRNINVIITSLSQT
jgi:hypothetical protein